MVENEGESSAAKPRAPVAPRTGMTFLWEKDIVLQKRKLVK